MIDSSFGVNILKASYLLNNQQKQLKSTHKSKPFYKHPGLILSYMQPTCLEDGTYTFLFKHITLSYIPMIIGTAKYILLN